VCNTYANGWYGGAEVTPGAFPFVPHQRFDIVFLVEQSGFNVIVNGRHYLNFGHRMGIESVDHVNVNGQLLLHAVEFR
jgi:hypothetical protein